MTNYSKNTWRNCVKVTKRLVVMRTVKRKRILEWVMLMLKTRGFTNRLLSEGELTVMEYFPSFVYSIEFLYVSWFKCWTYTYGPSAFNFDGASSILNVQTHLRITTIFERFPWDFGAHCSALRHPSKTISSTPPPDFIDLHFTILVIYFFYRIIT
uniref:Uncharacterized protein n=1 Tax=Opuntia streptacantha TaxID=393608 RepID=A0A7C9CQ91_OPUST